MNVRNDINGLRALAVVPVLFFHAHHPWFQGGFLGVDIFFVISGYLITNLIYSKVSAGNFSFLDFYERRARRILPAFLFVLTVTTLGSIFLMVPYDLKNYGQSLVASIFSVNNILLYVTSGYWSLASDFKPLYHTWSLAVEEQYYLLAPLMIFGCYKVWTNRQSVLILSSLIFVISFLMTLYLDNREFAFLIIFTRVWELLAGAILALKESGSRTSKNGPVSLLGVSLIIFSYINPYFFSNNQAIVNALPVAGALLVIAHSDEAKNLTGRLLAVKPLVILGLISYSIYLWHQPVLAFLRLTSEYEPGITKQVFFSLLSVPLAYLTWRFIENPFRSKTAIDSRSVFISLSVGILFLSGIGFLMHKTYGFQDFLPRYSYGGNPQSYVDLPRAFKLDSFPGNEKKKMLVIGNSFARDFINMMTENDVLKSYNLIYFEGDCISSNQKKLSDLLVDVDVVVYARDWGQKSFSESQIESVASCSRYLSRQASHGKVFVLGVKNFGWNNNFVKLGNSEDGARVTPLKSVLSFNDSAKVKVDGYVDVLGLISKDGRVRIFDDDGKFITYDTNHLTKGGARYIGGILFGKGPLSGLKSIQ
jgi:peptidoglycan/LPS O-acetylase OafA/YrhL